MGWNSAVWHTFISIIVNFYKINSAFCKNLVYMSKSFFKVEIFFSIAMFGPVITFSFLLVKICTNLYRVPKICHLYRTDSVLRKGQEICTNTDKSVLVATLLSGLRRIRILICFVNSSAMKDYSVNLMMQIGS